MIVAAVNWTTVLVALIGAIPATIAAFMGLSNRRALKTPSGDSIGGVVERTHDLAAVITASTAGTTAQPQLSKSVDRINGDPEAPVSVDEPHGHLD